MKIFSTAVLILFLLSSCGFKHPVQTARFHSTPASTPAEYYGSATPASFTTPSASPFPGKQRAESGDSTFPETKSDHTQIAIIGVIAGLLVVAGIVVPIVLLH